MSLATESIGASHGTLAFHVKVFVLHGLMVNVCGVPVQVHFSPSKAMLTDHVPAVFSSVFECNFHSESLGLCFINNATAATRKTSLEDNNRSFTRSPKFIIYKGGTRLHRKQERTEMKNLEGNRLIGLPQFQKLHGVSLTLSLG